MKIGYLVPAFPSQTHAFFWRELSVWREQGHDVHLFSTTRPDRDVCMHAFAEEAHRTTTYLYPPSMGRGVVTGLRHPAGVLRAIQYAAKITAKSLQDRARVAGYLACSATLASHVRQRSIEHVHVHSCANSAYAAAICSLICGVPYSLTLHGDMSVYGIDHGLKMKGATFVSAVTRPLQEAIVEETGLAKSCVPVVTMGVDCDRFAAAGGRDSGGPLRAVTVARLHTSKGHRFALAAIRKAVDRGFDIRYRIAGGGRHEAEIAESISEYDLDDRVEMLGSIGEEDVVGLLREADVFMLTSAGRGEAAPVSVMEAMACGKAVICSIIGGTPDMIDDGIDGFLVPQKDVDRIAECLIRLAESRELRVRIGEAAAARARRQFDYRVTARQLLGYIYPDVQV